MLHTRWKRPSDLFDRDVNDRVDDIIRSGGLKLSVEYGQKDGNTTVRFIVSDMIEHLMSDKWGRKSGRKDDQGYDIQYLWKDRRRKDHIDNGNYWLAKNDKTMKHYIMIVCLLAMAISAPLTSCTQQKENKVAKLNKEQRPERAKIVVVTGTSEDKYAGISTVVYYSGNRKHIRPVLNVKTKEGGNRTYQLQHRKDVYDEISWK